MLRCWEYKHGNRDKKNGSVDHVNDWRRRKGRKVVEWESCCSLPFTNIANRYIFYSTGNVIFKHFLEIEYLCQVILVKCTENGFSVLWEHSQPASTLRTKHVLLLYKL